MRRRRLESAAEYRCRHGCCRRDYSSLRRRRLESATEDRCRYSRCRRNRSSLRQRKTESDADLLAATAAAGETILLCGNKKNRIGRGESLQSRGKIGKNHAVIPKSGHQLMNQCKMDIFEGAKEFGTFLETRGNANQNPKRYERHYQTCFISSIGSCGHSGPCQQLRPVKRRKLYNFTQQFFIIA